MRKMKNISRLLSSMSEETPVEKQFLSDLKRSIELTEEKNSRIPSQTYKPSGMNCIRQSYYQITGYPQDPFDTAFTLIGIQNSGTDIHVRIQDAVEKMKENGMDCEYVNVGEYVQRKGLDYLEVKEQMGNETHLYHKDLNISFLCDGIIKYKKKYYIIEFKTESSRKFYERDGVNPDHYQQAKTYSLCLGLDKVLFVYISRDNLDMKAYMFEVTDDMRQDIVGYITNCDSYIEQKKVPPKPEKNTKACTYCRYKNQCELDN